MTTPPRSRPSTTASISVRQRIATSMFLYSEWLPQSGEEPRDFPLYFQRVEFFPDVPEYESVTDVFLPIR